MLIRLLMFFIVIYSMVLSLSARQNDILIDPMAPVEEIFPDGKTETDKKQGASSNANIDARAMYGQYNNIFSSMSLTQNFEDFSYQLNSNLKRSNDYGYENSSFYESGLGFTGSYTLNELWLISPQISINNESHGMYDNPAYSREEKDRFALQMKSTYNSNPTAWEFSVNGAQYVHRLIPADTGDVRRSGFYKVSEDIAWEYILSASNKFRVEHSYHHYFYSIANADNDYFTRNRGVADIKLMEYVKLISAVYCDWNRDAGVFVSGKAGLASSGLKSNTWVVNYEYYLKPFNPENFNFEQKFIRPNYDLPPEKIHHVNMKYGFDWNKNSREDLYLKKYVLMAEISANISDNYYNYSTTSKAENLIDADPVESSHYKIKGETQFDWKVYFSMVSLGVFCEYNYFRSDVNITYRPEVRGGVSFKYKSDLYEYEWNNTAAGPFFLNPESELTADGYILGSFTAQKKLYETFYLYGRIDNLYNSAYAVRFEYPEPGITFLAGLRVKI